MIKAEPCSDELGPATELGKNNPVMNNILWTYFSSYLLHNRSGHFIMESTVPVWSWSWSLENINNFRGNLLSFYRSRGDVRNTFFRQITPHNRCYILPKLLHYTKVAGFVQNTTKNCARRYYLGYDLIVISLFFKWFGGWWVVVVKNIEFILFLCFKSENKPPLFH